MKVSEQLQGELTEIRRLRVVAARHRRPRSRLDRYRAEIEALDAAGASTYDIALCLRKFKRTRVHPTTVWRALKRWKGARP